MKKLIFLLLFAVLGQRGMQAQTALSYGDVVICGWNNNLLSGYRQIQLVLLKDCTAGTVFKISANGFNNSGLANAASNSRNAGGISKWTNTTGATLPAGTVITTSNNNTTVTSDIGTISNVTAACACGANGSPILQSTSGGRFFIFYGSEVDGTAAGQNFTATSTTSTFQGTPISLFGFQGTQSGYTAFLTSSGTTGNFQTYLPSDLAAYNLFLASNAIGGYFTPSRSSFSSVAALRAALLTPSNWLTVSGGQTIDLPIGDFTVTLATTSFVKDKGLSIYPNPVATVLYLDIPQGEIINRVLITDVSGKIILDQEQSANQVQVQNWAQGLYFIQVFSKENKWKAKFIKE